MSYSKYYNPTNWENYPSEDTAINAMHLNNLEDGVDTLDDRIVALSTGKSEVSWNQTLISGEKIAEITVNGITKDVYAPEISDSVVEQAAEQALKSEGYAVGTQGDVPVTSGLYYHNNSKYYSEQASDSASDASASAVEAGQSADDAEEEALVSEGWAVGEQNGVPVPSTSPYYHNNSKYWSQQSNPTRFSSLSDVNFGTLEDDDIPVYDATSQKWVNETGVSTELKSNTTGKFKTRSGGLVGSCKITLSPKQSGSGTPSPSNVRPITGHTSVEVGNVGKNRLKPTGASSVTSNGVTFTKDDKGIVTLKGTSSAEWVGYTFSENTPIKSGTYKLNGITGGSLSTYRLTLNIQGLSEINLLDGETTFTVSNDTTITSLRIIVRQPNVNVDGVVIKPMIRLATETDATFAPYQGQDITINLGGTYYGGSLDVMSGVLTVTHAFNEFDGSSDENWTINGTGSGQYPFANIAVSDNNTTTSIISNEFAATAIYTSNQNIGVYKSTTNLRVRPDFALTDATAWKTWLSSNPLQVCYPLATPLTIQLTPTQIETLIGENNVSVPLTGQSLDSLSYREVMAWDDVEKAIEPKADISAIGTDESGRTTASKAYAIGEHFYKDGKFGKTKASVAQGATWTLNTNYEEGTIADAFKSLDEYVISDSSGNAVIQAKTNSWMIVFAPNGLYTLVVTTAYQWNTLTRLFESGSSASYDTSTGKLTISGVGNNRHILVKRNPL